MGNLEAPLPAGILLRELAFGPPLFGAALADGRIAIIDSVGYRVKIMHPIGSLDAMLESFLSRYMFHSTVKGLGIC